MNHKFDITFLMPAIRVEKWQGVIDSIEQSFHGSWELIIITEKTVPDSIKNNPHVKILFSERSPLQKQQQALSLVEGRFCTVMSDDQLWYPNKLDEAYFAIKNADYKTFLIMKYTEGKEFQMGSVPFNDLKSHSNYDWMGDNRYYLVNNHDTCKLPGFDKPCPVISTALISTQLIRETGGWDCQYQVQGIANCDYAMRLINYGCTAVLFGDHREFCSYHGYLEADSGDHGPLHGAIIEDDEPLLTITYSVPRPDRIFIDIDNWKNTPMIWKRKPKTPDNIHLSVICPGIRTENWRWLYQSIQTSFSGNWEIIFVGPKEPPDWVSGRANVVFIKSFRSPIACQQQGLLRATGKYITWASDDGEYVAGALDKAYELLQGKDYKTCVLGKYIEGDFAVENKLDCACYYLQKYHNDFKWIPQLPKSAYILNCAVITKQLAMELGGWDAENFQVCPMAYHDFSNRCNKYGCKIILQDELMFRCGHFPGESGDHGPIHIAQVSKDQPKYYQMYMMKSAQDRLKIDVNNWEKSEERWGRRFKEVKV